jgi:hypothetical protein
MWICTFNQLTYTPEGSQIVTTIMKIFVLTVCFNMEKYNEENEYFHIQLLHNIAQTTFVDIELQSYASFFIIKNMDMCKMKKKTPTFHLHPLISVRAP